MKKLLIILSLTILLLSCVHANDSTIEINNVTFKLPEKYQGGEINNNKYTLDNIFTIRCLDDNIAKAIGLWASEKESQNDLNIANHPVRHFVQYNPYVNGNHSHGYFASGESIYEISWVGSEINKDVKKLIENTPKSKINKNTFYKILNDSVQTYKQERIDKLNQDAEHNSIESEYQSSNQNSHKEDTRLKEILLTHYY